MSGLRARIIRLERNVPTGFEAKLRALTDEELEARIDKLLAAVTEADVLELIQQAPCRFGLLERWRKLKRESTTPPGHASPLPAAGCLYIVGPSARRLDTLVTSRSRARSIVAHGARN